MATAIPAAIGVGGSIIGGIQGKGAAKRQEKLLQQQMAQMQPLINAQTQGLQFALNQGQQLFPMATNAINTVFNHATGTFEPLMKDYQSMLKEATSSQGKFNLEGDALMGSGNELLKRSFAEQMGAMHGLSDLQAAYRPFLNEGASAIEKFLPKGATLNRLLAGQFGDINQGFKSASQNIEAFAPRGGGRVSSLANADINRQQQLTKARSEGTMGFGQMALNNFFQGAEGTRGVLGNKAQIAGMLGQQGLGEIGAGQQSKQLGIADFGAKSGIGLQQLQAALQSLGLAGGQSGILAQLAGGTLGQGLAGGGQIYDLFNQQANRMNNLDVQNLRNQGGSKGLGGFLVDLFNSSGIGKKKTSPPAYSELPELGF